MARWVMSWVEVPRERWARHLDECRRMLSTGEDIETVLAFLRRSSASKIESMAVLIELQALSPDEAKIAVHYSEAWRDTRDTDEALHRDLMEAARKMLHKES